MNFFIMLTLFLAVSSIGYIREVFARTLVPSVDAVPNPDGFGNTGLNVPDDERRITEDAVAYFNNQEELLDVQIQEFNLDRLYSSVNGKAALSNDDFDQSVLLVKAKATRQIDKKVIRSRRSPCLFKLCKMGIKSSSRTERYPRGNHRGSY